MRIQSKKSFAFFLVMIAAFVVGCGDPVPLKEMVSARHQISKAVMVKAEKYAPQQLKDATDLLLKSHDSIKADEFETAQKQAEDAFIKAKEAYDVAVPLLAKDAIDAAALSVAGSDETYASELANADFSSASEKLAKAKSLYESKNYYDAYLAALDADNQAKTARNLALSKKSVLKDAIDDVNETIARAEKLGAQNVAAAKLDIAKENVSKAQKSYDEMKLKECFSAAEAAKLSADEAYLEALKAYAAANITKAAAVIGEVESGAGSSAVTDEIAASKEVLATAQSQYDGGKYNESIQSSDEAKRLASVAMSSALRAESGKLAGNKTSAAGDVEVSSEGAEKEYDTYVVRFFKDKAKDCLWTIAGKFYNNPRLWTKIFDANRDIIKNPNLIRPGWKIKIPKQQAVKKEPAEAAPIEAPEVNIPAEKPVQENPESGN